MSQVQHNKSISVDRQTRVDSDTNSKYVSKFYTRRDAITEKSDDKINTNLETVHRRNSGDWPPNKIESPKVFHNLFTTDSFYSIITSENIYIVAI